MESGRGEEGDKAEGDVESEGQENEDKAEEEREGDDEWFNFDVDELSERGRLEMRRLLYKREKDEEINLLWYKGMDKLKFTIWLWLRCARRLDGSPLTWQALHARPLVALRRIENSDLWKEQQMFKRTLQAKLQRKTTTTANANANTNDDEQVNAEEDLTNIVMAGNISNECLVELIDGAGTPHLLKVIVNEGSADASTGIFGKVWSSEGIWALFHGYYYKGGENATYVSATELGLKRYHPYPGEVVKQSNPSSEKDREGQVGHTGCLRQPLPRRLFFGVQNLYVHGAEIEAILLAIGYLCARQSPNNYISTAPLKLRRGVMFSLLNIIQQRAMESFKQMGQINPMWPTGLAPELLHHIAHFVPANLPTYDQARFALWKSGERSVLKLISVDSQWQPKGKPSPPPPPTEIKDKGEVDDETDLISLFDDRWTRKWSEGLNDDEGAQMAIYNNAQKEDTSVARKMMFDTDGELGFYSLQY
jgi:hypothetical protein